MARIRTIKPKFWDDLKISKISRDARLTYIGMWNFTDDLGVIISDAAWLKSKIFPFDQIQLNQFEKWITELVKHGFISLFSFEDEKFYYLPNLTKHQVINRPNFSDVFIQKPALEAALNQSMINHGLITEASVPEGKGVGKEWKGMEVEVGDTPKKTEEIRELLEVDAGLVETWVIKTLPKDEFKDGVKVFINQRLKNKYKDWLDLRQHFIYWMPNYYKSIKQAVALNGNDSQPKIKLK